MPRSHHRARSGRRLPLVLIGTLVVAGLGLGAFVLLGRGPGTPGEATELPAPEFSFQLGRTRVSAVDGEPAKAVREGALDEVHGVLDGLYTVAFVDPGAWQGGTFPDLPGFFHGPAAERVPGDLDDLSLGDSAAEVQRVEPGRARLTVSLLFDEEEAPVSAYADAEFRGQGSTNDGERLWIDHRGRYLLRPTGDGWRIVGYEVRGELSSRARPEGKDL